MEEFDFIVVGGGPGGCVVASRLTEDPSVSAVLIEAGPDRRGFLADNTAAGAIALVPRKSSNNWAFDTVPDPGLNNRRDYHPYGRGLGGGMSVNTLLYVRGNRRDYDEWAALGNPGWSYDEVLPYFRKSENNQSLRGKGANAFHGTDGPLWVEDIRTDNPWQTILKQACIEAGEPYNPDFNGAEQEGFNTVQVMMKNGERFHTGKAYIHPFLGVRQNLALCCDTVCSRILFEGTRAVGVEVVHKGEMRTIRARKEVIVAGGGLLSAKLLQLSGVGDGAELRKLGITSVAHLPAVGGYLQDHPDICLAYHIPGDPNLFGISPTAGLAFLKAWRRWQRERRGMLATSFTEVTGFMRLSPESPKPEIQYEFVVVLALDHGRDVRWKHGMSNHVLLLHPKSRGSVKLASPDFNDDPVIDFRYFSHPDDMKAMVEGVKRTAQMFHTPTMSKLVKRDLQTAHCKTDEDWADFCRTVGHTNYHPVGSCRMGPDPATSVVDARLRIHGLDGIRVIDSSIMPFICGGNTNAPTIMIGEKGADMIKQDWQQA
jgi:choline dehydrogenase-like flavoprotein